MIKKTYYEQESINADVLVDFSYKYLGAGLPTRNYNQSENSCQELNE